MYDIYIMVFSTERKFLVNSLTNYSCCFNIWYMYICIQQNMLFGLFQKQFIKSWPSSYTCTVNTTSSYTCTVNTRHTGFCWTFSHSVLSDFFIYNLFLSIITGLMHPLISALSCLLLSRRYLAFSFKCFCYVFVLARL